VHPRRLFVSALVALTLAEAAGCGSTDTGGGNGASTPSKTCPTDEPPSFANCEGFAVGLMCHFADAALSTCSCEYMDTSYYWYCVSGAPADGGHDAAPPDAGLDATKD
jgi:hypothetical protein